MAVLLLLAGCGGSEGGLGGGPNEPGGEDELNGEPESPPDGAIFIETQGSVWSAYRDGDGAWRVLQSAKARHTISVENAGGRYAVAHVCLDEAETVTAALLYATTAARPEILSPCTSQGEDDPETFYTLAGTLNGLAAGETGRVHGAAQTDVADGSDNTYSLAGLTEGTYDLLVAVYADLSAPPREVLLSEEVSVTGDRTLDLALEEAAPTTLKTLTVEGASGDEVSSSVTLVTERNTRAELGTLAATSDAEDALSYDYAALPSVPEGTRYYLSVESVFRPPSGRRRPAHALLRAHPRGTRRPLAPLTACARGERRTGGRASSNHVAQLRSQIQR